MANSKSYSFIQFFFCFVLFFNVAFLHANTTQESHIIASTICPKTKNSSLCWGLLKPMGSMDALNLANYTLGLAQMSAVEGLRHARRLEATETTNPQLNKRYSECSHRFNSAVGGLVEGKEALATGGYIVLEHAIIGAKTEANGCLSTFDLPPPERSSLPKKAKDLVDICDVAAWVSSMLAGDDY